MTRNPLQYRLRTDRFDELTTAKGWRDDLQRATNIGVSHSTISRIRARKMRPGLRFIGLATAALGVHIDELFEIEQEAPTR
ncbi:hypothetical protein [Micromonospora sp. DT47]|uniref:hypothetical protein n=1 Tax=Micromonospora sp. DT47 TaxID=3393431 RepID=UPI003CEDAEED